MSDHRPAGLPQPTAEQLRLGLDGLVATLAVVVLLRAVLLDEPHTVAVGALVATFVVVHVARAVLLARTPTPAPLLRYGGLALLVVLWAGMVLLHADAAYVSVGLFLLFLTELTIPVAVAGIATVTAFDIMVALVRDPGAPALVAPLLGAVLAGLFGLGYRVLFEATAAQRRLIDELHRTRAELAGSEHAAGRSAERQRLAREIHDTVAQGLSSIQMLLHAVEAEPLPDEAARRVALARTTAANGLREARRMVAELAPADLADAADADSPLVAALRRVCERRVRPARLLVDGTPAPVPMPVEAALVRITQSALANVEQHAGPDAGAVVTLGWTSGRIRLDVVDDGVGFDATVPAAPPSSGSGFGLGMVRTRVAELGGDLELESEPGHTAVSVSFPIADPDPEVTP